MKPESLSRRNFFQKAAIGGAALAMAPSMAEEICKLWAASAEHQRAVLTLEQMLTVGAVVAQIIPTDDTPGAREAGVVEYINEKLRLDLAARRIYEDGLANLDSTSKNKFNNVFVALDQNQQREILKGLEQSPFVARVWRDINQCINK